MEQISCEFEAQPIGTSGLSGYFQNISEVVESLERNTGVKLYPKSTVEYWKHRVEAAEKGNALNSKLFTTDLCNKNAEIRKLQVRNDMLRKQIDERDKQIELLTEKRRKLEKENAELRQEVEEMEDCIEL